jgi:LacI family transcriptional regulator
MVKRPTIADLASASGVSVATVDRVLNRRMPVSADTARRVVLAAESIGYHAAGLLRRRHDEAPVRRFGFLLQKRGDEFYQRLAAQLGAETAAQTNFRGKSVIEFVDDIAPSIIAARIRQMSQRADALAVVAVDHPLVNEAVGEAVANGKPVFTLLSDLTSPARAGYLGVDTRKAGRTAAWAISRLTPRKHGKIGILLGSHRYLSQQLAEISFRSYMRENSQEFQILEPLVNLDDGRIAYEAVADMTGSNPDLIGIYVCGGGMEGLVKALREETPGRRPIAVCNELIAATRAALIEGVVDMVLGTPIAALSARIVAVMARACEGVSLEGMEQILLPADIYIRENI